MKNNPKWSTWCKTLGTRVSECDKESDWACAIRSIYAFIILATSFFIIANTIHHW